MVLLLQNVPTIVLIGRYIVKTRTNKDNLCNVCKYTLASCEGREIVFGCGLGKDNIINCDAFKVDLIKRQQHPNILAEDYWGVKPYPPKESIVESAGEVKDIPKHWGTKTYFSNQSVARQVSCLIDEILPIEMVGVSFDSEGIVNWCSESARAMMESKHLPVIPFNELIKSLRDYYSGCAVTKVEAPKKVLLPYQQIKFVLFPEQRELILNMLRKRNIEVNVVIDKSYFFYIDGQSNLVADEYSAAGFEMFGKSKFTLVDYVRLLGILHVDETIPVPELSFKKCLHIKSGSYYWRLNADVIDATNSKPYKDVAVYTRNGKFFIRELSEFKERFIEETAPHFIMSKKGTNTKRKEV